MSLLPFVRNSEMGIQTMIWSDKVRTAERLENSRIWPCANFYAGYLIAYLAYLDFLRRIEQFPFPVFDRAV
jgi:hypothetical protein